MTTRPRSASGDPDTSREAAAAAWRHLPAQLQAVAALVRRFPGQTSAELADVYANTTPGVSSDWQVHRPWVARRLPELRGVHVEQGPSRECLITRRRCVTWWPLRSPPRQSNEGVPR